MSRTRGERHERRQKRMTRIREETHGLPTREAVVAAIAATGTTVTTAGMILGGTFAVLAVAGGAAQGGSQISQVGYGVAFGVIIDTFIVRTILVPALVVLLGRLSWWPSRLANSGPAGPLVEQADKEHPTEIHLMRVPRAARSAPRRSGWVCT